MAKQKKTLNKTLRKRRKVERKEARQDKHQTRKKAKTTKTDAREEKREDLRDIRKGELEGARKREAKKEVREEFRGTKKKADRAKQVAVKRMEREKDAALDSLERVPKRTPRSWDSYLDFQRNDPKEAYKPRDLGDVVNIVQFAIANRRKVRVVGSGHSFSNILDAQDILVTPYNLGHIEVVGNKRARLMSHARGTYVDVGAGATIRDLDRTLEKAGLGMINQGTYEGQRLWGAVSTSTHGSGVELGPFCDMVRSVLMVVDTPGGAEAWRIEPKAGFTKTSHREPGVKLVRDDDLFCSAICSMGCFGVAVSALIEVRDFYFLDERGKLTDWEAVRGQIATRSGLNAFLDPKKNRHVELLVSTNRAPADVHNLLLTKGRKKDLEAAGLAGKYATSILRRDDKVPKTKDGKMPVAFGLLEAKSPNTKLIARNAWLNGLAANNRENSTLAVIGAYVDRGQSLASTYYYRNSYYFVFPRGGKKVGGFGFEIAAPYEKVVEVLDFGLGEIERIVKRYNRGVRKEKDQAHFGPVGVRFVAPSRAFLSPQYDRTTVMFEFTMLYQKRIVDHQVSAMRALQQAITKKFAYTRVHWGLELDLLGNADVAERYPRFRAWLEARRRVNAHGVFDNAFTRRLRLG